MDRGKLGPTPPSSAIRQRVPGGIRMRAIRAIVPADFPTMAGFNCLPRDAATTIESLLASDALKKCPPCLWSCSRTAPAIGVSTTTDCSEEQIVPLSKHLPARISCTAFSTSAVRSTNTGTLPGPTPKAGLPDA